VAAAAGNADAQTRLGESLIAAGDQAAGTRWLRHAADRGNGRARTDLTTLYREEELPDADLHRGENPVAALAKRLDARGLNSLFAAWRTIETNTPLVLTGETLVSHARQGDPVAEYQLGMRYRNGAWAVTRDPQQASFWLQRSAAAGNRLAAHTLAESQHSRTAAPSTTAPPAAAPGGCRT
jgi:TPR repeat protein